MNLKEITYPQYRKYPTNKSFFKIISPAEFEEIQEMNGKYIKHHFDAKILPDRNYIYDLTFQYEGHWLPITEKEYIEIERLAA